MNACMENKDYKKVTSVGSWVGTIILSAIPVVNVIYWIVLLLGGGDRNKVNLIRALVLIQLICVALGVGFCLISNIGFSSIWYEIKLLVHNVYDWLVNAYNTIRG